MADNKTIMAFFNWYFLIFYGITLSCGLLLFRSRRSRAGQAQGWRYKAIAVLGLTWGTNVIGMGTAAMVGGMAWVLLIVIPSVGIRQVQGLLYHQDYASAYRWTVFLRYLHPFDGWWEQPKIVRALQLAHRGQMEQARLTLARYHGHPNAVAQQAIAMTFVMQHDWLGLLQWLETQRTTRQDPLLLTYYCRALGETAQLHTLLETLDRAQKICLKRGDRQTYHLIQLFATAFCGEVKLTEQLLSGCLSVYTPEIKQFWQAIAWAAAGEKRIALKQLTALKDYPDEQFQNAVRARLQSPPAIAAQHLQPESYPLIAHLTREIHQANIDRSYQSLVDNSSPFKRGFSINNLLILLNLLVFLGGIILNLKIGKDALLDLGGFVPLAVEAGEWWRIITATFIHVNWSHLLTNLFTLYILGNFAERHLGKGRYLMIYLASGIGAMVILLGLVNLAEYIDFNTLPKWGLFLLEEIRYPYRLWVGASGSIMGMIGAIAVVLFRGWQRKKSQAALRQLRLVLGVILLQFLIDLSSLNVSFYSHFLGLLIGAIVTAILTRKPDFRSPLNRLR